MNLRRRGFLAGLGAALAAPALIRPGILMPVRRVIAPEPAPFLGAYPPEIDVDDGFDTIGPGWRHVMLDCNGHRVRLLLDGQPIAGRFEGNFFIPGA